MHGARYVIAGDSVARNIFMYAEDKDRLFTLAKLLLGDTTTKRLFSSHDAGRGGGGNTSRHGAKPSTRSLSAEGCIIPTNRQISLAGQYLLLHNVLSDPENKVKMVVLCYHPSSFKINLEDKGTYYYFTRPFYSFDTSRLLSPSVRTKVTQRINRHIVLLPLIKTGSFLNNLDHSVPGSRNQPYPKGTPYLSDISIEYLNLIKSLCLSRHVAFKVICPPLSKHLVYDYSVFTRQIVENDLADIFSDYFSTSFALDATLFVDDFHFTRGNLNEIADSYVNKVGELLPR